MKIKNGGFMAIYRKLFLLALLPAACFADPSDEVAYREGGERGRSENFRGGSFNEENRGNEERRDMNRRPEDERRSENQRYDMNRMYGERYDAYRRPEGAQINTYQSNPVYVLPQDSNDQSYPSQNNGFFQGSPNGY